jgi:hypothetical protein
MKHPMAADGRNGIDDRGSVRMEPGESFTAAMGQGLQHIRQ